MGGCPACMPVAPSLALGPGASVPRSSRQSNGTVGPTPWVCCETCEALEIAPGPLQPRVSFLPLGLALAEKADTNLTITRPFGVPQLV